MERRKHFVKDHYRNSEIHIFMQIFTQDCMCFRIQTTKTTVPVRRSKLVKKGMELIETHVVVMSLLVVALMSSGAEEVD